MTVTPVNPGSLHTNPAFSQGTLVRSALLLVVGGQQGTDAAGELVSADLGEQTEQALRNVLAVLGEAGADQRHVAQLSIHVMAGTDITAGYTAAARVWGEHPTAVTVLQVAGFARPGVLVEVGALAAPPPSPDDDDDAPTAGGSHR